MSGMALDIGGTKIAAGRIDDAGRLSGDVATVPTPTHAGADAVVDQAIGLLREVVSPEDSLLAVSCAGVVNVMTGVVVSATDGIQGWAGVAIRERLSRAIGLPAVAINDGHAFALGEYSYGAARNADSLLLIAVGTGIGGSMIDGGKILLGANSYGGHIGHLPVPEAHGIRCPCGAMGHAEAVGGGAGILASYRRNSRSGARYTSVHDLVAATNDEAAQAALELGGRAVGTVAGGLINVFDPALVVLTGGVTQAGPLWTRAVMGSVAFSVMPGLTPHRVVVSSAGPEMALRGAMLYARERVGHDH